MDITPFIEQSRTRFEAIESELSHFDFTAQDSQEQYRKLAREHDRLGKLLIHWDQYNRQKKQLDENRHLLDTDTDPELLDMLREETPDLEQQVARAERDLKAFLLPPLPNEDRDIIVEIRPAAGGDEASLFAAELYRMYTRFAEMRGWKIELLDQTMSDVGGLKDVAFSLQGDGAYRLMRFESGVHRVQRIPETESGGRIHTSTVTVAALPEADPVELDISPEDLRVDVFRSSGPGGQSVNTTDSAVRITHVPSGVTVSCQREKSQHRNRETAMRILRSRLLETKQAEEAEKNAEARRQQVGSGDRSERIRTYNFPQSRLTDHRFAISRHDLPSVMEGNLEEFLKEIQGLDAEQRLQKELSDLS